jgi:hypothetical protein
VPAKAIVLDSVTHLTPAHRGLAAVCASHGGVYAAACALHMGVGALILNDAGIGREGAGVAGLQTLAASDIPAACISHRSARIGDARRAMRYARGRYVGRGQAARTDRRPVLR